MTFNAGVVVVCAGIGKRLGVKDKAKLDLGGKPLFYHAVKVFSKIKDIRQIILVLRKDNFPLAKEIIRDKKVTFTQGGVRRCDSVRNGLAVLRHDINYVLIHDGARPFVSGKLVRSILKELRNFGAVICAVKCRDTVKVVSGGVVKRTLARDNLISVQTPQGFRKDLILSAYSKLKNKKVFDDAQVLELAGEKVKVVEGDNLNFKVTYPEDVILAKAVFKQRITKRIAHSV